MGSKNRVINIIPERITRIAIEDNFLLNELGVGFFNDIVDNCLVKPCWGKCEVAQILNNLHLPTRLHFPQLEQLDTRTNP